MSDEWNPRNPRVIGLEWPVRKTVTYTLDSIGKAYGWVIRSSVQEEISQGTFYADAVSGGNAKYAMEVYNLDDPDIVPEGIAVGTSILHAPPVSGIDQDNSGYFDASNPAGVAAISAGANCANTPESSGYGDINTDNAGTVGAHWINVTLATQAQFARIMTSVQSFDLTGQRIIAMTVRARGVGVNATIQPVFAKGTLNGTGFPLTMSIQYVGEGRNMGTYLNGNPCNPTSTPDQVAPLYEWRYERNPLTNFPWTNAEIMSYMVSAPRTAGFPMVGIEFYALQPTTCALLFFEVEIEYCTEDRVSFGYQDMQAPGFKSIALVPFTKNVDETLLVVVRKLSDGPGTLTVRGLESDGYCPVGITTVRPQVLSRAGQLGLPLGDEQRDVAGILLRRSDAVYSIDSQVYMGMRTYTVDQDSSATQTFQCDVAGSFGYLSVVAATQQVGTADGPLTLQLYEYVTGLAVGDPVVIAVEDMNAAPQILQYIGAGLEAPAALSAAGAYYVQVTTPSAPGNGWIVAVLDTLNSSGAQNVLSFGGPDGPPGGLFAWPDTSVGSFNGGQDMPFTVVQAPPAPRGFTVTKASQ